MDLVTKQEFRNFELELEWKVSPGGNGGIFYRAGEDDKEIWHSAPEIQVLDDGKHGDGKNPKTSAASLYALVAPVGKRLRPVGEFNHFRLVLNRHHGEHWLNGVKVVEYELGSRIKRGGIFRVDQNAECIVRAKPGACEKPTLSAISAFLQFANGENSGQSRI